MMSLADLKFSDLILTQGKAFLKGTPEFGQQLRMITPEMAGVQDFRPFLDALDERFKKLRRKDSALQNIRVSFENLWFRAANCISVEGNVYFLRRLADEVPNFASMIRREDDAEDNKIRSAVANFLEHPDQQKGLILFCGSQVSGKTTLASSFVAGRLHKYGGHAVTFETPVEMPLSGPHGDYGFCFQTEVNGEDELAAHIERAHRYGSPNIIYVGEILTKHAASEVLRVSLGSSQQLVVATIHGLDITSTLSRLMAWASEVDGDAACHNLSQSLLAIIYQELKSENGKRILRIPEVLLTPFNNENFRSVRSKLRDGRFTGLTDEINQQRNLMNSGFWEMEL